MKEQKKPKNLGTDKIVAKNINAYRFMLGLDCQRFGERTGLSAERIHDMEQGKDVLQNGIELLRIAEACNVPYSDLFEDEKSGGTSQRNAYFPEEVWSGICKLAKVQFGSAASLAKLLGVHPSTPHLWFKGEVHPNPFAFQNLITLLKLKAVDLEGMVIDKKLENAHKEVNVVTEEPVMVAVESVPVKEPENALNQDTFENKVIKLMKLQKEMDHFVERLDKINQAVYELRNELMELV